MRRVVISFSWANQPANLLQCCQEPIQSLVSKEIDNISKPRHAMRLCKVDKHCPWLGHFTKLLRSDTPQTIRDCNPHLKQTALNHMAPYSTIWYHMANTAQDGCWKRHIRMHISDSLSLFPKDQIISFIQLHYKASQLAILRGIL